MSQKLHIILIIAAGFLAHANGLQNGFVWDDEVFVVENEGIRSFKHLGDHVLHPDAHMGDRSTQIWRPVRNISYTIDFMVWKLNPMGFHLMNLLLHLCCCTALYVVGRRLMNDSGAFFTALIFAAHPVLTEAVSWIKGRDDLQAGLFWLLGILAYLAYRETPTLKKGLMFLGVLLIALLSKEAALGLVPCCIMIEVLLNKQGAHKKANRPVHQLWLAGIALTILYVISRTAVLGQVEQAHWFTGDRWSTWLTMVPVFVIYIRLALLPINLVCDYSHIPFVDNPTNITFITSLLLLVAIMVLCFKHAKKYPVPVLGVVWFIIGLGPVSNLVPTMQLMAERFIYIPLMGLSLTAGWIIDECVKKSRLCCPAQTKFIYVTLLVLLATAVTLTHLRNNDWKSNETLFTSAHKTAPANLRMRSQLAIEAVNQQQFKRVIELMDGHLTEGLTTPKMIRNLAWSLSMSGEHERGKAMLTDLSKQPIKRSEVAAQIHEDLGHLNVIEKNIPAAIVHFTASTQLDPKKSSRWSNLATAQLDSGLVNKAKSSLKQAIIMDPRNISAMQSLASLAWSEEAWPESAKWFRRILDTDPNNQEAIHFLQQAEAKASINKPNN